MSRPSDESATDKLWQSNPSNTDRVGWKQYRIAKIEIRRTGSATTPIETQDLTPLPSCDRPLLTHEKTH
ncbi:hypothetical protein [Oxynema aestuarii]|uniref:Uncharacterized protein n=1 Tax=Oxynema aestuarii AP17 TaxID=2064643 RepID=A0A6H1TYA7_9CYAN|nr:hypothetical protein [Oxynema aestuarii]QIZ71598.1 hypothetical protein HCG48_14220 [Oxynema aestuarii AP17]